MLKQIQKTREYLDYLERHYNYVQRAWEIVQKECPDLAVISDDFRWGTLDMAIKYHDESKLSAEEFVQYRQKYYPVYKEEQETANIEAAWQHHLEHNGHHWQSIVKFKGIYSDIQLTHMVIDWMAMSYEFNDTAQEYYEKNKDKIKLSENNVNFIYAIFERVYPKEGVTPRDPYDWAPAIRIDGNVHKTE